MGAATKLRLAIYLPVLVLAVVVLLMRSGAFASPGLPPNQPPPPITEWSTVPATIAYDGNTTEFTVPGDFEFLIEPYIGARLQWRLSRVRGVIVLDTVATAVNGRLVQIDAFDRLYVDGREERLANGSRIDFGDGDFVARLGFQLVVHWQEGSKWVEFRRRGSGWSVDWTDTAWVEGMVTVASQMATGRLSAANRRIIGPVTAGNLKRFFRSWRVPEGESLLSPR